jgi:hypothetical protein
MKMLAFKALILIVAMTIAPVMGAQSLTPVITLLELRVVISPELQVITPPELRVVISPELPVIKPPKLPVVVSPELPVIKPPEPPVVISPELPVITPPTEITPTPTATEPANQACIQVTTEARNPTTGEQKVFPTPCDVPEGWIVVNPEPVQGDISVE